MKRYLDRNRYRLDEQEKGKLWYAIRREIAAGRPQEAAPRTAFKPALGVAAALAVATLVGAWIIGNEQADRVHERAGRTAARQESPHEKALVLVPEPELKETQTRTLASATDGEVSALADAAGSPPPAAPAAAPRAPWVTGRVFDKETGEVLAQASILIRGTTRGAAADSNGRFRFGHLEPGREVTLQVMMLGYAPQQITVTVPDTGAVDLDIGLGNVVVATLSSFDVEGAEYRVEAKSVVTEHAPDSESASPIEQPGVVMYAGEGPARDRKRQNLFEVDTALSSPRMMPPAGEAPVASGSVTGGTKPPNGQQVELMYFDHTGVNPFVATDDDALSTFAVDVDNASWTLARNYLGRGMLPPKEAIRVEEFVNAFDAGWPENRDRTFRIHTEGGVSRFGAGYHLLRVGLVGRTVTAEERKPANLVFVIDTSGSMGRENRLGLVKRSLHLLLDQLSEGDRVGIVVYGSRGEVRLQPADISERGKISAAIDGLGTGGSTNVYEGLDLAYAMARQAYDPGSVNRLVLCSDGVANNGMSTKAEEILELVRRSSDEGITISTIGFGMGNYNDVLMEKLADKGDGNYYYVDRIEEAQRVFTENLTGLLQTIAREVKVQVEFDPAQVDRWRLLGYENRDVADRDFRNDAIDAGEVGSGHQVTALYELKLKNPPQTGAGTDGRRVPGPAIKAGTVRLRYEAPAHDTAHAGEVTEIEEPILLGGFEPDFAAESAWMRVQAVVAEFAEILRGSYWARESTLAALVPVADGLVAELPGDRRVKELAELIRKAADLEERAEAPAGEKTEP